MISNKMYVFVRSGIMLLGCITLAAMTGCATTMSGGPVTTKNTGGIRYYLPAPHIVLTPKPDGTIEVKVEYLPDPNNAYTLDVDSYFSSATIDVTLSNGMLTKINLNADSSEVAEKAIEAGSAIQKARMDAEQAKKKAEHDAKVAEETATEAAVQAVKKKEEELDLLVAKLDFYKQQPDGAIQEEHFRELDLQILETKIQLDYLKQKAGITAADSANNSAAFNAPDQTHSSLLKAWGPVFFRVLSDGEGVKLVAVEGQKTYQTSVSRVPPKTPSLSVSPSPAIVNASDNNRDIVFTFSQPIKIDITRTRMVDPSLGVKAAPILEGNDISLRITDEDSKKLLLVLPKTIPKGKYRLALALKVQGDSTPQEVNIDIHWLVETCNGNYP